MFAVLLIPISAEAQMVSVDPYSFELWGELKSSTMISAEQKILDAAYIGVRYILVHDIQYSNQSEHPTYRQAVGISATTPYLLNYVRGGLILFNSPFPTSDDTHLNAFVEASYPIGDFRIHYRHISNAGRGLANHGIDYIGLDYQF